MPDNPASALLLPLAQSIEALALEAALRELSSPAQLEPLARLLVTIRKEAEAAGMTSIAEAVSSQPETEADLRGVIALLQQLIALPPSETPPTTALPLNQDPELVADFILESREHLSALEAQLLLLEQDPGNAEAINTIFRGFHTIKGLAGFLEYPAIQSFAHEVETLLHLARTSVVPIDSILIDIILQSADYLNQCLKSVETGSSSDSPDTLLRRIREISGATQPQSDLSRLAGAVANPPVVPAASGPAASVSPASASAPSGLSTGRLSVKVDTGKLDYLVEMVGELVIAQSLIRHDPDLAALRSARMTRNLGQLTRITTAVQNVAMTMRMIPVGQLFGRMARLVRDLARKSGKQAELDLTGEDTELDRSMVEELADPLMHMIRNAVDHGAESPEARIACGKSPLARLHLKAWHTGGFINIEVSDDGRGMDREKILAKARQRGLLSSGENLSDQEVFRFIFEPGFSTAERVTDVSGRGVGLDVVRKQVVKLRGRIDISSRPGCGTTFVIKLPLTMAVIDGLVVGVGVQRYIVPLSAVKEIFRPAPVALSTLPDGGEVVLQRGSLLPILRLHRRFGVVPASEDPAHGILIVVEGLGRNFCLFVDELIGKQEIVIKSLGETFRNVTGIAGGSILGDGRVGLIVDVEALFGNPSRK